MKTSMHAIKNRRINDDLLVVCIAGTPDSFPVMLIWEVKNGRWIRRFIHVGHPTLLRREVVRFIMRQKKTVLTMTKNGKIIATKIQAFQYPLEIIEDPRPGIVARSMLL